MVFGPTEAFTPEQYAELYDVNVLGTQRVNRTGALPTLRRQKQGLLVWVSSTSSGRNAALACSLLCCKGGNGLRSPCYAGELARWGIETSIIVPGAFTKGTNHFAHAGAPADKARAAEYASGPTRDIPDVSLKG